MDTPPLTNLVDRVKGQTIPHQHNGLPWALVTLYGVWPVAHECLQRAADAHHQFVAQEYFNSVATVIYYSFNSLYTSVFGQMGTVLLM